MRISPPDPIAFSVGPYITVYWYGILIGIAILLGVYLALREAEKQGVNTEHFFNLILIILPAAFIGARLYYVIFNWDYYSHNLWEIPATWHGGLAIHGGIIGGILGGLFLLKRYHFNFWQIADIVAPSLVLGQAIGRWGNFFNQEAYGYVVDPAELPWAMYIDGAYRHPTFLYESLWDLLIFGFLLWLRRRKGLKWGDVALFYVVLYSIGRFFIEGLRTDSLMLTPYLRVAQVVSALGILGGLSLLIYRHGKRKDKRETTESEAERKNDDEMVVADSDNPSGGKETLEAERKNDAEINNDVEHDSEAVIGNEQDDNDDTGDAGETAKEKGPNAVD